MADHASQGGNIKDHRETYESFLKGVMVLCIICAFVLVALCSFSFAHTLNVFMGFVILIVGVAATLIEAKVGNGRWFVSLALLVIFGLITGANVL